MTANEDLLTGDRTESAAVVRVTPPQRTRTSQDEYAEKFGYLRNQVTSMGHIVADSHDHALEAQLDSRTDQAATRAVPDLLSELADMGFAWRTIARLVGVTVAATRKWRQGQHVTGQNRRAVARLWAFVDVLRSEHLIQNVSSWMEVPLAGSSITAVDVYARGDESAALLLLHAAGHISSDELLDRFEPNWRSSIDDRFEIVPGSDGEPIISMRAHERS